MSWTDELYNVYEKNWGRPAGDGPALLPVAHSTANAQIEIMLSEDGGFIKAEKVAKSDAVTVIPVTDDSAARGNGIFPHPFADELRYIAGDYKDYFNGKHSDNAEYFKAYMEQLKKWADSEHSHKAVKALYAYLEKECLMNDLISCGVFAADGIAQEDCFVRFLINYKNADLESRTWKDDTLIESFIAFNLTLMTDEQLCYATGKVLPVTYKHPSKIRNSGDKSKLISSNDESGFSYRGRFYNKEQAISVSYDFSQKMHNALKWLIAKQGVNIENSLTLIVWESSMRELPGITESSEDFFFEDDEQQYADTYQFYKEKLKRSVLGYKNNLDKDSKAIVMGIDSATTGRLSIGLYSELRSSEFLDNIESWHKDTAWFEYNVKQKKYVYNSFSLGNIINCAFGVERGKKIECISSKLKTEYVCRLVPCVIEGRKIPQNLIMSLVNRAVCPLKYDDPFNWEKVLNIACAMIRCEMIRKNKIKNEEEFKMALDENRRDRDYLYGRLLAVADAAESRTYEKGEKRPTNAKRYFEAFSNRPCTTWDIIMKRLNPYLDKLISGSSEYSKSYYENLINTITEMFDSKDFENNSKLKPIFLHAYSCQLKELYSSGKNDDINNEEE